MLDQLKPLIKDLLPPIIVKAYRSRANQYGYFGNYSSWQAAYQDSTGYDADVILEKVKDSLLKVKEGKAAYARDSVVFDEIFYPFPLLASLFRVAVENDSQLSVLDFGGSLGTSYYQCKKILSELKELKWNIVEQQNFVDCGKQFFEDDRLSFFHSINDCLQVEKPNLVLLSGVIQCLEKPYEFLEELIGYSFEYIVFDRTPFLIQGSDRLTVQKVSPDIYPASYPSWFFNLEKFLNFFLPHYDLIFDFDAFDRANIPSQYKGFFFKRK